MLPLPVAHPQLAEMLDVSVDAYALSTDGRLSSQRGPTRETARTRMHLDGELPRSQFHFLWPNLGVNIFPGRPNISIGPIVPLAPDRTLPVPRLLLRPPTSTRPGSTS